MDLFDHEKAESLVKKTFPDLSLREKEISVFWILDYDYKFIAEKLNLSEHTVRTHIKNIHFKLCVKSKASMILKLLFISDALKELLSSV